MDCGLVQTVFGAAVLGAGSLAADGGSLLRQYDGIARQYAVDVALSNHESRESYFRHFVISLEGKRLLDLGCGDGGDFEYFQRSGASICAIDASEEMVVVARNRRLADEVKVGYFESIPFPDQSFDIVTSKWAFQTSADIDPIYLEIARVLRPGGTLLFLTSHPMRQFVEKKRMGKDYFKKEIVESVFFDGKLSVQEPSHTLNEYLSATFFELFALEAFEEGYDSGAEKVGGDTYPSYFVIRARLK